MHLGRKLPGEAGGALPSQLKPMPGFPILSQPWEPLEARGCQKITISASLCGQNLPREDQYTVLDIPVCNGC